MPTPMPDTNSLPMDTFAREPQRIMAIPGGMMGVIMADAAVTTDEKPLLMPFASMGGTSSLASIAASARLEPDRPPIRVDSSTFTCARPPHMWPVSRSHRSMIRLLTPEAFIKIPAHTKKGTASSVSPCTEEARRCARIMEDTAGFRKK